MASSLDHIEQTLADAYRREIDQAENIWRSLPFFAATLTLELGAIAQIAGRLPPPGTDAWRASIVFIGLAGVSTVTAIGVLIVSIFPVRLRYIPPEPDLLDFSERLDAYELRRGAKRADALALLKRTLAHEYAASNNHNRQINGRRVLWRSVAGLAMLIDVLSLVALVSIAATHYASSG